MTVIVELTNTGAGPCALQGNPTVTFLDDSGSPVEVTVQAGSGEQFSGAPVAVVPGGHAYLTFLTRTDGSCAPTGADAVVIGISGAPNTTKAQLGSATFCPPSADLNSQSYPVTAERTGLS